MCGNINDPRIAAEVGAAFGGAARDLRGWAGQGHKDEADGSLGVGEPTLTDGLVRHMRDAIAARLREITDRLRRIGTKVAIEYVAGKPRREAEHGADIGVRVHVETPDSVVEKAILVQCKRMTEAGFPELADRSDRGRGEEQAKKMLRITPASFFMLFNYGEQSDLIDATGVPVGMLCPIEGRHIPPEAAMRLGSSCDYWRNSDGTLWDMGVAVLPAARVLAMSAARGSRKLNTSAESVLPGCLPLGVFMVDLFAGCYVGDVREEVVRLVTPPTKRVAPDVAGRPFDGFAVRHYLDFTVRVLDHERPRG